MGKFGEALASAGASGAIQAGQGILGMMFGRSQERHNDERQIAQQRRLQDMQQQANMEMMKYGKDLDFEMWQKTNYGAQMKELAKAGLNPGLLYGMSGGGGVTTGGGAGSVSGGSAASVGGEGMGMSLEAMRMNLQLMNAQKENIEADTANKLGDAANKPLVGENIQADTLNLTQGVENKKAEERLTRIQGDIAELDREIKDKTLEDAVELVNIEEMRARTELDRANRNNEFEKATYDTKYRMVKVELTTMLLNNAIQRSTNKNIQADTTLKRSQTAVNYQTIKNLANDIVLKGMAWESGQQNANTNERNQQLQDWKETVQKTTGIPMEALDKIIEGFILKRLLEKPTIERTEVKGFRQ